MSLERPPKQEDKLTDKVEYVLKYATNAISELEVQYILKALRRQINSEDHVGGQTYE